MRYRFRHILFDLDGTIFDSYLANMQALLAVLDELRPGHGESMESLGRFFGVPGQVVLQELGFASGDLGRVAPRWYREVQARSGLVRMFPGIAAVLQLLHDAGLGLGIITSRERSRGESCGDACEHLPVSLRRYFEDRNTVCCDDVDHPKPAPDPILRYLELHRAAPDEVLYIGDTASDLQCASSAGVAFGLALWGYRGREYLPCSYYFKSPFEILTALNEVPHSMSENWFRWASELGAIAQIGLTYEQNPYNQQVMERLRDLSETITVLHTHQDMGRIRECISFDRGYRTPKVDTRAAVFDHDNRILMVRENSGQWSLPGGWCDEHESVVSNTVKEVREEAGLEVYCERLIAIVCRNRNHIPHMPYGVLRFYMLCAMGPGHFVPNIETVERRFFARDQIPPPSQLRLTTLSPELLAMCFEAHEHRDFVPVIE